MYEVMVTEIRETRCVYLVNATTAEEAKRMAQDTCLVLCRKVVGHDRKRIAGETVRKEDAAYGSEQMGAGVFVSRTSAKSLPVR